MLKYAKSALYAHALRYQMFMLQGAPETEILVHIKGGVYVGKRDFDSDIECFRFFLFLVLLMTRHCWPPYIDDLEAILDEFFLKSLSTYVEDGSIEEVAYKLMVMHEGCLEGKFQSIERLRETNQQKADVHHVKQVLLVTFKVY
nr:hypothetical protein CFP56_05081 [Quercus suber]